MVQLVLRRMAPFFLAFISIEFLLKMLLIGHHFSEISHESFFSLLIAIIFSLVSDTLLFIAMMVPFAFYLLVLPHYAYYKWFDRAVTSLLFVGAVYFWWLSSAIEWQFWLDSHTRIEMGLADVVRYVDSLELTYSDAFIGTIIGFLTLAYLAFIQPADWGRKSIPEPCKLCHRWRVGFVSLIIPVLIWLMGIPSFHYESSNPTIRALTQNGKWNMISATLPDQMKIHFLRMQYK